MIVTGIKKIGKGQRYYLVLDEAQKFVIEAEILAKNKIKTGDEIDENYLQKILLENGDLYAFDRALTYLEKNMKTEKGIREYLKQKGFLDESIEKAVEKLIEYGYINDEVYAENYIRTYGNKKGKKKLKFELLSKGVSVQIIEEKLEELLSKEEEISSCREIFKKYKDEMIEGMKTYRNTPCKEFNIISYDGLRLHGKYFECDPSYPTEILFHGYKGTGERDLGHGITRAFAVKHNALIVDQRSAGLSDGKTITFGIKERYDVISWINFVIKEFGDDVDIYITGISMGAATVCMASNMNLPSNVKGILADCGYDRPEYIIKKVVKDMKLPVKLIYPFIRLSAKIFGGFNLEEYSPMEAVSKTNIPIIFIHGNNDELVPCEMSRILYEACNSRKKLVVIENAGHGVCYIVEKEKYIKELYDFINK